MLRLNSRGGRSVEEKAVAWREKHEASGQANAAGKNASTDVCGWCKNKGHKEKDCNKKTSLVSKT